MIRSTLKGLGRADCSRLIETDCVLDPLPEGGDHLSGAAAAGVEDHQGATGSVEQDAAELADGDQGVIVAGLERRWWSRKRRLAHLVHGESLGIVHVPEP